MFPLIPADLLRLLGLALVPLGGAVAGWPSAAVMFLVFGTQWLLRWLVGGRVLDWTGQTVLLAAGWCSVTGLYHRVEHLDLLMHAATSAVIAGLAAVAVRAWLRRRGSSAGRAVRLLGPTLCWAALVSAVGTLGVLWEVAEWIGHRWITAEIGVGYEDTVTDLAANLIGAAAASGWVLRTVEARTAGVPAAEAGDAAADAGGGPVSGAQADRPRRPTVSVVVPVRDDAAHLRACLALLGVQSRRVDEVVVVDNGSRDHSADVARAAGARVVVQPVPGIPAAASAGYDAARGDLILRCDADSRPAPDWVERICAVLESAPEVAGVTGPPRFVDRVGVQGRVREVLHTLGYRWCAGAAAASVPLWGSNFGLRAAAWKDVREQVERVDPLVHDDLDLSFCLALSGRHPVVHVPTLRMGASGRGFTSAAARRRQLRMAVATLRRNWAVLSPGQRWVRRLGRRAG